MLRMVRAVPAAAAVVASRVVKDEATANAEAGATRAGEVTAIPGFINLSLADAGRSIDVSW